MKGTRRILQWATAAGVAWCVVPGTQAQAQAQTQDVWIGTAPFCRATPGDCTQRGMDFVRQDIRGDGKPCARGHKVLCRPRARASGPSEFWIGTPPFCRGEASDCHTRGMDFVRSEKRDCTRGQKVLCRERTAQPHAQKQPFYIIAHGTNTVADIETALRNGANAIELDVHYNRAARRFDVFHGGVAGLIGTNRPGLREDRVSLNSVLDAIGAGSLRANLALVIFDFKNADNEPMAAVLLRDIVRARLGPNLPILISVGSFDMFPLLHQFGRVGLRPGDGIAVDQESEPIEAERRFRAAGVNQFAFGNGIDVKAGDRPRIGRSIREALQMKQRGNSFRMVYVWTIRTDASMREYLEMGVDGIFVNANNIGKMRMVLQNFAATRRLATRADNPFR